MSEIQIISISISFLFTNSQKLKYFLCFFEYFLKIQSIFLEFIVFFSNSKYFSEISRIKKYMNSSIGALERMH